MLERFDAEGNRLVSVEDGDPLQQVPEYTFSSSIDYSLPLKNIDYDWFTRLDFSYVDSSVSTVNPAAGSGAYQTQLFLAKSPSRAGE